MNMIQMETKSPALINTGSAQLPQSYENAKTALADCVSIDECQSWADKAAALASYAKQAKDEELMKMATRIRDRAIRRAGELLKQIEPSKGGRPTETTVGTHSSFTRTDAARDAGMSAHQQAQAVRVANIPEDEFTKQVESSNPPTVTKLAEQGKKSAPTPVLDLKGRDPGEFNRSMHFVAEFEEYAKALSAFNLETILPALTPVEASRVRVAITTIDAIHDRIITRI